MIATGYQPPIGMPQPQGNAPVRPMNYMGMQQPLTQMPAQPMQTQPTQQSYGYNQFSQPLGSYYRPRKPQMPNYGMMAQGYQPPQAHPGSGIYDVPSYNRINY